MLTGFRSKTGFLGVLLGVVLRGLQNWRLSLVGTPMLVPPLQWPERGGPKVHVICLLGCGQASAGLDLMPQEHKWKWLVLLLAQEREIELRGYLDLQLSVRRWQDWCILASPGIRLPEELGEQEYRDGGGTHSQGPPQPIWPIGG